jgi:hypothetical protein
MPGTSETLLFFAAREELAEVFFGLFAFSSAY